MAEPPRSLHAQLVELLGYDPEAVAAPRPSVADAAAGLRPGTLAAAVRDAERVAVVRLRDGRLFVLPDRCPHDGGVLSDGFVEDDQVVCARHGWRIDPCGGECLSAAPGPRPDDDSTR